MQKMAREHLQELRERKIVDVNKLSDIRPLQGTTLDVMKHMLENASEVKDQSAKQIEKGKQTLKKRKAESQEQVERKHEARKKG